MSTVDLGNDKRPFITCHILSSIDGRISGSFMGSSEAAPAIQEYARLQKAFGADAFAYGTTTTKGFVGSEKPHCAAHASVPEGDYVAAPSAPSFYVSLDPQGEIAWKSGIFQRAGRADAQVIELVCETTPKAYLAYLRNVGVSYVLAGKNTLDLPLAMNKLYELFHIEKLLVCGGGATDAAFLCEDLLDEISIVFAPVASGQAKVATIFDESEFAQATAKGFKLQQVKQLSGDVLHLVYRS